MSDEKKIFSFFIKKIIEKVKMNIIDEEVMNDINNSFICPIYHDIFYKIFPHYVIFILMLLINIILLISIIIMLNK